MDSDNGDPTVSRWGDWTTDPTVVVIAAGGSISGRAPDPSDPGRYEGGVVDIEEMVGLLRPSLDPRIEVRTVQLYDLPRPWGITRFDAIAREVDRQLLTADAHAVVVTVGTDVLEELSWWLDLTAMSPKADGGDGCDASVECPLIGRSAESHERYPGGGER